jgi:tetratricopeptide (TPR) repeat protein
MLKNIEIEDNIGKNFVVKDILGGGMGKVYICLETEYKFMMALKTFQDTPFYFEEMKKRFENEALAWIHLEKHANIVTAHSFDIIDNRPFILLEPIVPDERGRNTLEHYIETDIAESQIIEMIFQDLFPEFKRGKKITYIRPLFLEVQILDWSIQFCHGMEYAKSKGVTPHRDIKPANIMITKDNVLKITDFGLAKIWDKIDNLSKFEDIPKEIISFLHADDTKMYSGTPAYMAPEQFNGHADFRSDIYSFGVILYQMINIGIPPFENEMSLGWEEAHKKGKIKRIESDIFPIVEKCLEKKPEDRYQSFEELRHDLEILYKKKTNNDPPKPPKEIELEAWEYTNKAYALKKLGYIKLSISHLKKAISLNPDLYQAHMNLGIDFIECEQYKHAIQEFKEVIKINPNHAEAHYNIANISTRIGDLDNVIYHYNEAIRLNPKCKQAHVNKGNVLKDMELIDEAISEYNKAINIDESFFKAIASLGNALRDKKLFDEAISQYELAKKINPKDSLLYNNWGLALSRKGDVDGAIKMYIKSLTLDSEVTEVHNNLGTAWNVKRNYKQAIYEFNEAIRIDSKNIIALTNLGGTLIDLGDYDTAILNFEKAIQNDPSHIGANINLAHCLIAKKEYSQVISKFKDFKSTDPEIKNIYIHLGIAYVETGEVNKGIGEFKKAFNIDPSYLHAKSNLILAITQYGKSLLDQEKYMEAIEQYNEVIKIDPLNVNAYDNLGVAFFHLDQIDHAIAHFKRALEIDPKNENAKNNLKISKDYKKEFLNTAK